MPTNDPTAAAATQVQSQTEVVRKNTSLAWYERSVLQVHEEFGQLDPGAISGACTTWKKAADELFALADDLKARAAVPLDAAWQAPSSPAAQTQLQYAEATARALASDCLSMAHATDYAAQYAQWYKENLPSYTDAVVSGVGGLLTGNGLSGGAEQAVTHMVKLLERYTEVIQVLPDSVKLSVLASTSSDNFKPPPPGSGGGPGVGSAGGAGAGLGAAAGLGHAGGTAGSGPSAGALVGGAHGVGAGGAGAGGAGAGAAGAGGAGGGLGPGAGGGLGSGGSAGSGGAGAGGLGSQDPYAPGTSLAGAGGGGGLGSFDPAGAGGLGSGLAGAGGAGAGGLGGGLGAGVLGAAGLGAGGLAGGLGGGGAGRLAGAGGAGAGAGGAGLAGAGAPGTGAGVAPGGVIGGGAGGSGAGAGSAGARGAGRAGAAGATPMHGGHGGGDEEERERSTWLLEDEDVWSGDGEVPPPVIGG